MDISYEKVVNKIKLENESLQIDIDSMESLFLYMRTAAKYFSVAEKRFNKLNISKGKFNVLIVLFRESNKENSNTLSLSEIADSVWVTKSTITGLIDGLEKDGFVERDFSNKEDRRRIKVKLTDKGIEFLNSMLPSHFQFISSFLKGFTKKEKENFKKSLNKLYLNLEH